MNHNDKKLLQEYRDIGLTPTGVRLLGEKNIDLELENIRLHGKIDKLKAELALMKKGKSDAVENLAANMADAFRQLDAAIEDMRGICYLCKKAEPYSVGGTTMMTCHHIKGIATNKHPKCPDFEWRGIKDGM